MLNCQDNQELTVVLRSLTTIRHLLSQCCGDDDEIMVEIFEEVKVAIDQFSSMDVARHAVQPSWPEESVYTLGELI